MYDDSWVMLGLGDADRLLTSGVNADPGMLTPFTPQLLRGHNILQVQILEQVCLCLDFQGTGSKHIKES